jgi:hypothetical protein
MLDEQSIGRDHGACIDLNQTVDRVLSLSEAGVISGVSPWTLKRANKRGSIKFVRPSPRRVGVRHSELERWLSQCSS